MMRLVLQVLIAACLGCSSQQSGEAKVEQDRADEVKALSKDEALRNVKSEAETVAQAFLSGDHDKVVDLTHPKIVELVGGRARQIAYVKEGIAKLKQITADITYDVCEPSDLYEASRDLYAVVPTRLEIKGKFHQVTQRGFLLGVSLDGGRAWKFIEGNALARHKDRIPDLLPNLPEDLKLPEAQRPVTRWQLP